MATVAKLKKGMFIGMIIFCAVLCMMLLRAYTTGKFDTVATLQEYIKGYGVFGPFMLICIQALQVIVPVLPGFLGCAVGTILFGTWGGFICNYIGISIGSIVTFLLARCYGNNLVEKMFPSKIYVKWARWGAESKSYASLLFLGMVLPLFPDDFFCYFTGLTKMTKRKFILIIILGKPWCILAYSILFQRMV